MHSYSLDYSYCATVSIRALCNLETFNRTCENAYLNHMFSMGLSLAIGYQNDKL